METSITDLIGKILIKIENDGESIGFTCTDGTRYQMHHEQNCCEDVRVEDVIGDLDDLIGYPIVKASEDSSDINPEGIDKGEQESFTWTFYNLATTKGHVTIRWYGESNGYYSESVDFVEL